MIRLLARRSLGHRPVRAAFLMLGFALGAAVMIVLLSVGSAILEQARDRDLLGGGDVVILPAGVDVEALKIGGLSAMFFRIPNAKPLVVSFLEGPRFRGVIETTSPQLDRRLVYVGRPGGRTRAALASAAIPSRERRMIGPDGPAWEDTPASRAWLRRALRVTPEMDAFHLPAGTSTSGGPRSGRDTLWAEWHYFNLRRGESDPYGMLTFMVAGDVLRGRGRGIVMAQWRVPGGRTFRVTETWDQSAVGFSTERPDLDIGPCRVRFADGVYSLTGTVADPTGGYLDFDLSLRSVPGYFQPPFDLPGGDALNLGYVIPVLRGTATGRLRAGGRAWDLDGYTGYHDHNWGIWDRVRWDWGQAVGPDVALFYGAVRGPTLPDERPVLALVTPEGLLQLFRVEPIERSGSFAGGGADAGGVRVPRRLVLRGTAGPDSIRAVIETLDAIPTTVGGGDRGGGQGEGEGEGEWEREGTFVQILGRYDVAARVADRPVRFTEVGFAEIFVAGSADVRPGSRRAGP